MGELLEIRAQDLTIDGNLTITSGAVLDTRSTDLTITGQFNNEGVLRLQGDESLSFTQDLDSGKVEYVGDGDGMASIFNLQDLGPIDYYDILINPVDGDIDTFNINFPTTIMGDWTMAGGTYYENAETHVLGPNTCNLTGGTYNQNAVRTCTGDLRVRGINSAATWNGSANTAHSIIILGDLYIDDNANSAAFTSTAGTMTIGTNFDFVSGTFNHNNGTVIMDNGDHSFNFTTPTSITFNNFAKTDVLDDSTDETMIFQSGVTYNFDGTLTLNGIDDDDRINIVTDTTGVTSVFNIVGGSASATVDFIDVIDFDLQDNGVTMNPVLNPTNSLNSGNTTGWFDTISGVVYTDEGVTTMGAGKSVRLLVNGVDEGSTGTTNGVGAYSIQANSLSTGDVLTLYLDEAAEDGVTVTKKGGTAITDLDIYQNYLITRSEDGTDLANSDLDLANDADPGDATDITSIYDVTSNILTTTAVSELLVWTGDVFTPVGSVNAGGNLDIHGTANFGTSAVDIDGDLEITGTFSASTGNTNMAGDFINSGTFTHNSGDVILDGAATQNITSGGDSFYNLQTSNTAADISLVDALTMANNLTTDTGSSLNLSGNDLTVTGTFSNDGTVALVGTETLTITPDIDSGAFEYRGDNDAGADTFNIQDIGATDYYSLVINSSDSMTDTFQLGADLSIAGMLTFTDGTFDANTQNIDVVSDVTVAGGWVGLSTGAIDIDGSMILTGGTLTATSGIMNLAGNWNNAGTFNHNSGTVVFDGGDQILTGISTFNNLTKQDNVNDSADVTITFPASTVTNVEGALTLQGLDSDDRVNLVSASAGNQFILNLSNAASSITFDYLDIIDSDINATGGSVTLPIDPSNTLDSGNLTDWFTGLVVELSSAAAASTDESTADNFPSLLILGTTGGSSTVDLDDLLTGTATSGGTDYTFTDPTTITIPSGTYDGTIGTALALTAPVLNDEAIQEDDETIDFTLTNASAGVSIGDANADLTTQTAHTYTITKDDLINASIATTSNGDEATPTDIVYTVTLSTVNNSGAAITFDTSVTGGTATSGTDFTDTTGVGTISIADGASTGTLTVTVINDSINDPNTETVDVTLSNPSNSAVTILTATASATITDNDSSGGGGGGGSSSV